MTPTELSLKGCKHPDNYYWSVIYDTGISSMPYSNYLVCAECIKNPPFNDQNEIVSKKKFDFKFEINSQLAKLFRGQPTERPPFQETCN